ncbi:uncharacterized protein CIMG_03490 [Coccidioides immitis RS]|uniref:Uncharacterized protein n=7 Tax=Coccidioides TaxID=5500 RepID=J3KBH3_COCIM|nr:uncharacterized protein CIMG_03490 [Coccidioides immitis RS]XP_003068724.1 hypothetical protein CPC735_007520 [Coccidioides posadasii C735 delta SOWgp]EFW20623.1 conserved hypothetical protein [Coccidioides posadasii str. Silveira]KMP07703.1 hypothetical protein CIRG_07385 [Coccidioides immitis RMSCC 2394]KMU71844.1 hypothetical protein CISG_00154 [Coccidioides immitis RMSCC 3703]KMU82790.1 hypothetical protein CIHG_00574 [Coccidioides immitis H538.4]TPX19584.1 hypothetical protein DIZ76_0|eukprot:XP_003068724.1 hypothetical protein CPC735_007520 [Coccidioides posadasii C735 delta SOWgp]
MSGSPLPSRERLPSPVRRRASNANLLGAPVNRDDSAGSRGSRRRTSQLLGEIFSAAELEAPGLLDSPRDDLPYDRLKLEGLVNYHVGQLERLKREIQGHNETIGQLACTLRSMRHKDHLVHAAGCLNARIQGVKNTRNRLAKFVMFHLQEMERIEEFGRPLGFRPGRFRELPTFGGWNRLFADDYH